MSIFQAIILGIVQGITEFLPVSSSGHLVLLHTLFGIEEGAFTFDIIVHIGSLVAIVVFFWRDIWGLIKKPLSRLTGLLIIATIPAVVVGFLIRGVIDSYFRSGIWLAAAFTLTGFLLVVADNVGKNNIKQEKDMRWFDALFIGFCQAVAIAPGISRSGATITGGLTCGLNRETTVKFSFFMAIIAIAGAGVLEGMEFVQDGGSGAEAIGAGALIVGFFTSMIVGYFCIKLLLKLIESCKLRYFSFYLWVLAALIFVDWMWLNLFFQRSM